MNRKEKIKEIIVKCLELNIEPKDILDETPLFESGGLELDSIEMLEILSALEKEFNVVLELGDDPAKDFFNINSIDAMLSENLRGINE